MAAIFGPAICVVLAVLSSFAMSAYGVEGESVTGQILVYAPYAVGFGVFASAVIGMPGSVLLLRAGQAGPVPFVLCGIAAGVGIFAIFAEPGGSDDLGWSLALLGYMMMHSVGYSLAFQWMMQRKRA